MTLSVLIGTRDRPQALRRCLDGVAHQQRAPLETIVFDDASVRTDVDAIAAESAVEPVGVLRAESPVGVAEMRNRLVEQAAGEICIFIDDDAQFQDAHGLAAVADAFEAHPEAAAVAARIEDHFPDGCRQINVPFPRTTLAAHSDLADQAQCVSYFVGAGHAIRRRVFVACGGYASFLHFGGEEVDLSYRILQNGYTIRYAPDVRIRHHPERSALDPDRERPELFYHVRNRFYLAWRYIPARYLLPYAAYWAGVYAFYALRNGDVGDALAGAREGWRRLGDWPREPVDETVVAYLRAHHGRLWR
jgi:GT2 family glycosyltransferase